MSNYSKFKERTPEETIFEIRRILNDIGLFTVQQWIEDTYDGAKSCRVTIYPTGLGTNGKGTDVLYSTASAYAELMERLNNNLLTIRDELDALKNDVGFYHFPDEKMISIEEIAASPDPFTEFVFSKSGLKGYSRAAFLKAYCRTYGIKDNMFPCVPFADPVSGTVRYIPHKVAVQATGSNGMAAGNTLDEAMVQGLSEIFEREASRRILKGEAIPPEIPIEEVKKYSFYTLIREVEKDGRFRVTLYDLSMGRGWPVTGLCITDLTTGNFGMKLGAHPSFAVSVERTLTEALQGKNLEYFANSCRLGTVEESSGFNNIPNVGKTGDGVYPYVMFGGKPDWEYRPWTRWEGLDNKGFLAGMIQILKAEGLHPLFRDTSFLGFPSCFIIVPFFSDLFPVGETALRAWNTWQHSLSCWNDFPDISDEEELRILKIIRFREYSVLENQIAFLSCRQLSAKFDSVRVAAFIALKHGKYEVSRHFFDIMVRYTIDEKEKLYYMAMCRYLKLRGQDADHETALNVAKNFTTREIADKIENDTSELSTVLQRNFPRLHCYDCSSCSLAGTDCTYPDTRKIFVKVARAMKAENADQDKLLEELINIW